MPVPKTFPLAAGPLGVALNLDQAERCRETNLVARSHGC
jgi:hypothetical protein